MVGQPRLDGVQMGAVVVKGQVDVAAPVGGGDQLEKPQELL